MPPVCLSTPHVEDSIVDQKLLANLEVKSKAPNGVTFTVKGKSAHEGPIAGQVR